MLIRARHLAFSSLALLSLIAAVLWVTSYQYPIHQFIDFVGSIKRQREIQEELGTKGQAKVDPWFGPIGEIAVYDGTLTLKYSGGEYMGSIPAPLGRASPDPEPRTVNLSLVVLEFHFVGSSDWRHANWQCDFSLWFLSACFGIYPAILFLKFLCRRRNNQSGRCDKCGYDLTGLVDPRCPECGKEFFHAGMVDQR